MVYAANDHVWLWWKDSIQKSSKDTVDLDSEGHNERLCSFINLYTEAQETSNSMSAKGVLKCPV